MGGEEITSISLRTVIVISSFSRASSQTNKQSLGSIISCRLSGPDLMRAFNWIKICFPKKSCCIYLVVSVLVGMIIYLQISCGSEFRMQVLLAEILVLLLKLAPSTALLPCAQVLGQHTDACIITCVFK